MGKILPPDTPAKQISDFINLVCRKCKGIYKSADLLKISIKKIKLDFSIMFNKKLLMLFLMLSFMINLMAQNVSIKLNNVTVERAMTELKTKSGYTFVYESSDVDLKKKVDVKARNIEDAVRQVIDGQDLEYKIKGKNVILFKKTVDKSNVSRSSSNKKKTIKGTVKDRNGEPIIGASVMEKGTHNGTITDINGNYVLSDVDENGTIVISYVGFKNMDMAVGGSQMHNITLDEDDNLLSEVVVVGFGTQKKVNLTGAVSTVDAETFESRPVSSATQALQGVVPGLQISTNSGQLDNEMSINLRGIGTIGEGSSGSPLILIDGMEGDLNTINPQDIENISVLKDAAAASIYGSRAPFGVILVTTKSGKAGRTSISYSGNLRSSSPMNMPEMMDSYTFANFFNSASLNEGGGLIFNEDIMQQMLDYQSGKISGGVPASSNGQWGKPDYDPYTNAYANTDWYKEVYKDNVFSQEHNLSVNGGSEKVSFYSSLNYMKQNGLLRHGEDGIERYAATAKFKAALTDWMRLNVTTRFIRKDNDRPSAINGWYYEMFDRLTWPNLPVYDPNGYYFNNNATNVAMQLAEAGNRNNRQDQHYYQAALQLEPIRGWVTNAEFNYSIANTTIKETGFPTYNHDVEGNVVDTHGTTYLWREGRQEYFLNFNLYSTLERTFAKDHNFKLMGGMQLEHMKMDYYAMYKTGLQDNSLPQFDLTTGMDGNGNEITPSLQGSYNQWATAGFFGRLNYDYKGIYLAELNLRYDGSSRFRRGSRWQTSPSISLGWNIAREEFWKPLVNTIGTLKLRFSYGELGNQNTVSWYPTYRTMNLGLYNGAWLENGKKPNTASVGDLISTSLTWETIRTWNVGLDYGLFDNRLTGSFDYFVRYTKNMVGPAPELPSILGINVPKTNNCDLRTNGWELSVNWRDRLSNGLNYEVGLSISDAKTVIESYPGNSSNSIDNYIAGREIGEIWGFETIGIAKTDVEMEEHLASVGGQDALGYNWAAGDIMYKDLDGEPGITQGGRTIDNHGDLKVIGNSTPRYFLGLNLCADWKGFDFRCFFQGVMKQDYWSTGGTFWGVYGNLWYSIGLKEHNDYFRSEAIGMEGHEIAANLDSYYPRPAFNSGYKNQYVQTRYLQNASYIRLKNLQIGYTLPAALTQKVGVNKCRLYLSGENLWTGTSLSSLYDPETISGGYAGRGNAYPLSRTFSIGLDLNF